MYSDRVHLYRELESAYNGKVLAYITGDRPNYSAQIAQDVIDLFIDQLDSIGPVERIVLYLYTRGGDTAAAWNIVNLIRMYCEKLTVVVPHKAHSAGTIICLGANNIVMTKQATLSPIDPSLNTPLNPIIPGPPNSTYPVSVEAVKGYIELAKGEYKLATDDALASALIKLSEHVHPLVLGQALRTRAQINMLATKLLKYQIDDEEQIKHISTFLCTDSGSHDYTINRREAADDLKLCITKPSPEEYIIIKKIYNSFAEEMGLGQYQVPNNRLGAYSVRRSFVESISGGSDYFSSEGKKDLVALPNGQKVIQDEKHFEGWRHESGDSLPKVVEISEDGGALRYEQDDKFGL